MRNSRSTIVTFLLTLACLVTFLTPSRAQAQSYSVLYAFTGKPDASRPFQSNLLEVRGNFFGATVYGGDFRDGAIYQVNAKGTEKVLYSFTGGTDGEFPNSNLLRDAQGNFYGTAQNGGDLSCMIASATGCGVVFKLDPSGVETVLYSFTGGADGGDPQGLVMDSSGNLYGTTFYGGNLSCGVEYGCGVFYELSSSGVFTVLFPFAGGASGATPNGFLTTDSSGNFYGATTAGGDVSGCAGAGCGVVYEVGAGGYKVLYSFTGGSDGAIPNGALVINATGNVYGTTYAGGDVTCGNDGSTGCGVAFELSPTGKEKVLHTFEGTDGANPTYGLSESASGVFYDTTAYGGSANAGTIFQISARGTEKVLYNFTGSTDGGLPESGLIEDSSGHLYGNTTQGGDLSCPIKAGCGVVFELKP